MKTIFVMIATIAWISSAYADNTTISSPRKLKGPTIVTTPPIPMTPKNLVSKKPSRTKLIFNIPIGPQTPIPLSAEEDIKEATSVAKIDKTQTLYKFDRALAVTSRTAVDQIKLKGSATGLAISNDVIDAKLADGSWLKMNVVTIADGNLKKMKSKMRITTDSQNQDILGEIKNILAFYLDVEVAVTGDVTSIEIPVNVYKQKTARANLVKFVSEINAGNLISEVNYNDALAQFRHTIFNKTCDSLFKL
jgi:hypothetical protein